MDIANKPIPWAMLEVETFLTLVADRRIQRELDGAARNAKIYQEVSDRMAVHGYNRTLKQCREKLKKLKSDYRSIKDSHLRGESNRRHWKWFDRMDAIYGHQLVTVKKESGLDTAVTAEMRPLDQTTRTQSSATALFESMVDGSSVQTPNRDPDTPLVSWSNVEIQALLMLWANPEVQRELVFSARNEKIYTDLSEKLASLGFTKTPKKCREKIKSLKRLYKQIKSGDHVGGSSNVWFPMMDKILTSQPAALKHSGTAYPSSTHSSVPAQSVSLDVNTDDEPQWLPDEIQVLMTLWAQPNIQKQLHTSVGRNRVFTYLSSELALVGFTKTPHQCSLKVNCLKEEYKRIKQLGLSGDDQGDWFIILDNVLCPDRDKLPEDKIANEQAYWSSEEVKVLLTRWAEESVQEQLKSTLRNQRVFAQLSSELATEGFDKTTSQCRIKIQLMKRMYNRIKEQKDSKRQKSKWFAIMDKVLGSPKSDVVAAETIDLDRPSLQASQQHIPETAEGCRLSVSSLCLLVPHLRLMSAFAWQVVQCRNVAHYGKVEELVRLVTELVPELLTPREKVQLLLRLRARLVLELCLNESTADLLNIQPHLKVIEDLSMSCSSDQEELEELEKSKSNFVEVVHTLLKNTEERKIFFKEVFPIHYGREYEVTLNTLVWKFISRLDNLFPIPDIKQTAEWLSTSPSMMEECEQLVLEPNRLKVLLHFHQQQSGSTNKCFSHAQKMFLPTLSLQSKANWTQSSLEQQEMLTDDEEQFDDFEDEDPVEENQSNNKSTVEDCSKGNEDLTLKDEQRNDMTTANAPNSDQAAPQLQTCLLCPFSDSQVSGLLNHIREEHLIEEPTVIFSLEPGQDAVLQKVNSQMHRSATDTCRYCGKVFEDVAALNTHFKTHIKTRPKRFHCDKCDKKYCSRRMLIVHQRLHTGERPFLCSHCGRSFRSTYSLNLHVRIHTGERPYKCHICGKTSIQHLARHMRMHRGEKNYLCTVCGKAFLSSGELRLHTRIHTGERPYTCTHCGKGFIAKCHLTVHTRKHTGETPYKCSLCPKSFHTLYGKKKHMRTHLKKKSFQCLNGDKIFSYEESFKMHTETYK